MFNVTSYLAEFEAKNKEARELAKANREANRLNRATREPKSAITTNPHVESRFGQEGNPIIIYTKDGKITSIKSSKQQKAILIDEENAFGAEEVTMTKISKKELFDILDKEVIIAPDSDFNFSNLFPVSLALNQNMEVFMTNFPNFKQFTYKEISVIKEATQGTNNEDIPDMSKFVSICLLNQGINMEKFAKPVVEYNEPASEENTEPTPIITQSEEAIEELAKYKKFIKENFFLINGISEEVFEDIVENHVDAVLNRIESIASITAFKYLFLN